MSVKNGTFQIMGDGQKMSTKPESSPSANPKGGQMQVTGTEVKMNTTPTVQSPSSNPKNGEFQIMGSTTPLNRTPVKGWGSAANLPMSERAIKQSQVGKGKNS